MSLYILKQCKFTNRNYEIISIYNIQRKVRRKIIGLLRVHNLPYLKTRLLQIAKNIGDKEKEKRNPNNLVKLCKETVQKKGKIKYYKKEINKKKHNNRNSYIFLFVFQDSTLLIIIYIKKKYKR